MAKANRPHLQARVAQDAELAANEQTKVFDALRNVWSQKERVA